MGHRGRERQVRCEKCGREVRRDKAVFIEKPILTNPLERKDVHSETYNRVLTREVSYCISCGKHGRIFEKKKKMMERLRERERFGKVQGERTLGPSRNYGYSQPRQQSQQTQTQPAQEQAPAEAKEKPAEEQQA